MNENIKSCLKEWYKWTKFLYKNGQKRKDKQKLEMQGTYWTEQIVKAKNDYTLKITNRLNDPKPDPKTCWSVLNRFLYNKKTPAVPPY